MPNLADKAACVGCTACASVCPNNCIEMREDSDGFLYPEINLQKGCVECRRCETVCPVLGKSFSGELPIAYAAISLDESIRMKSSSGGLFTELAKRIIAQNGVVYGAAYDKQFKVYHYCVDNVDDLHKLRGAKYAESNLGNSFVDVLIKLKQDQIVMFSGTPCQIAGLKTFLKRDYENLYCVDFVCHGVPSPMAWRAYVEYRAKEDANGKFPFHINLRSKDTGWSKYQYSNIYMYENGKIYRERSSQSLFMKLFVEDYISRLSCSNCKFKGYSRCSDITLGDFWGIWDIAPEMDDDKGTSLVLIQSEKGKKIFDDISGEVSFEEMKLEYASVQNPSLLKSSIAKKNRKKVLELIREKKIGKLKQLFRPSTKKRFLIINKFLKLL